MGHAGSLAECAFSPAAVCAWHSPLLQVRAVAGWLLVPCCLQVLHGCERYRVVSPDGR